MKNHWLKDEQDATHIVSAVCLNNCDPHRMGRVYASYLFKSTMYAGWLSPEASQWKWVVPTIGDTIKVCVEKQVYWN